MRDVTSGSLVTIGHTEAEINDGDSFKIDDVIHLNTTSQLWLITTPDSTKYAHMIFDFLGTGEMYVIITEGADRTTGTALAAINRRRVGTPTEATVTVKRGATGGTTNGAITIETFRIGSTDKFSAMIGETNGRRMYILKPNTKYVVSVETFADVYITMRLQWCEHEDMELK